MTFNKNTVGIITVLVTFFIVKVTFSKIGIENIPAPIIISLLIISFIMFITGVNKKKLPKKEKKYFILCASLFAISLLMGMMIVILINYCQQIVIEHHTILLLPSLIGMAALIGATVVALIVKKGRN